MKTVIILAALTIPLMEGIMFPGYQSLAFGLNLTRTTHKSIPISEINPPIPWYYNAIVNPASPIRKQIAVIIIKAFYGLEAECELLLKLSITSAITKRATNNTNNVPTIREIQGIIFKKQPPLKYL